MIGSLAAAAAPTPPADRPRAPAQAPAATAVAARAAGTSPRHPSEEAAHAAAAAPPPQDGAASDVARLRAQLGDPALRVTSYKDEASGRFVLEVRNRASGELVEQYPPDRLLRLFAAMREAAGGAPSDHRAGLVDERV